MTINHPDWVTLSRGGRLLAGGGRRGPGRCQSVSIRERKLSFVPSVCVEEMWRGGDASLHLAVAQRPRFAKANGVSAPEKDK